MSWVRWSRCAVTRPDTPAPTMAIRMKPSSKRAAARISDPVFRCHRMCGMGASRAAAVAVLSLRVAYGAALVVAPGRLTRSWLGPAGGEPAAAVAVRGLGAREVALHGAAIVAALRGQPLRGWLALSIGGDVCDIAATAASRRGIPDR